LPNTLWGYNAVVARGRACRDLSVAGERVADFLDASRGVVSEWIRAGHRSNAGGDVNGDIGDSAILIIRPSPGRRSGRR
jgi:hypothetical protein